jgi:hypothetical protein
MRTYAHEMGRMLGLPYGAAEIGLLSQDLDTPPSTALDPRNPGR